LRRIVPDALRLMTMRLAVGSPNTLNWVPTKNALIEKYVRPSRVSRWPWEAPARSLRRRLWLARNMNMPF